MLWQHSVSSESTQREAIADGDVGLRLLVLLQSTVPLLSGLVLFNLTFTRPLMAEYPTLSQVVEQAHSELWSRLVDSHCIIRDFVGELPTPKDCALGKPNAIGWWSPIEDGPMFTGLYLPAACEHARRSGDAGDKANARRLILLRRMRLLRAACEAFAIRFALIGRVVGLASD